MEAEEDRLDLRDRGRSRRSAHSQAARVLNRAVLSAEAAGTHSVAAIQALDYIQGATMSVHGALVSVNRHVLSSWAVRSSRAESREIQLARDSPDVLSRTGRAYNEVSASAHVYSKILYRPSLQKPRL